MPGISHDIIDRMRVLGTEKLSLITAVVSVRGTNKTPKLLTKGKKKAFHRIILMNHALASCQASPLPPYSCHHTRSQLLGHFQGLREP